MAKAAKIPVEEIGSMDMCPSELLMRSEEDKTCPERRELAMAVGDWVAMNPEKWRTLRMRYAHPEDTINELAVRLNLHRSTVIRHLKRKSTGGKEKC